MPKSIPHYQPPTNLFSVATDNVALVLVVGQEFPDDVFHVIRKQAGNALIVWLCQDRNNKELPDASVEKYICDGVDEWVVLNEVLGKYLKPFYKK